MVPARCDSRALEAHRPRNPATCNAASKGDGWARGDARTLTAMRNRLATTTAVATTALCLAALLVACSVAAPSRTPPAPTVPVSPAATVAPSPTPRLGVRAPAGVTTDAVIRGAIYLGFEACVGLTPGPDSAYLPPIGQDDFVVAFPKGWKVVPAHPSNPLFGDHFQVLDATGQVVAVDGDILEIEGVISMIEASYCGFGWPISVRQAKLAGS